MEKRLPAALEGPRVVSAMRARGWVIGGGYGKLKSHTIRIGHMGEVTLRPEALERGPMILRLNAWVGQVLVNAQAIPARACFALGSVPSHSIRATVRP